MLLMSKLFNYKMKKIANRILNCLYRRAEE